MANYFMDRTPAGFMLPQETDEQVPMDDNEYIVQQLMGIAQPRASYGKPASRESEDSQLLNQLIAMSAAPQASFGQARSIEEQAAPSASVSTSTSKPGIMPKSAIDELYERINAKSLSSIGEQKKSLKKTKDIIAELEKKELQTNLAPYLMAADFLADSNISQMYQKPMSEEERKMKILELENFAAKQAGGISDDELKLLGLQITRENARENAALKGAAGPKATADQWKAAGFAKRLEQAEEVFSDLVSKGYNRADRSESLKSILPGELMGKELKAQDQAERNFINAILRRESGAAISESEFSSAEKQYFPRPGDTPEILKQKAANRALAFEALKAEAGQTFSKIPTISPLLEDGASGWSDQKEQRYQELLKKRGG